MVTNIVTTPGQTESFGPADFAEALNSHLGQKKLDTLVVNTKKPAASALAVYKEEGAKFVVPDVSAVRRVKVILGDLLSDTVHKKAKGDKLNTRSFLRHDNNKLANVIWKTINN